MKTKLHTYRFNTSTLEGKEAFAKLQRETLLVLGFPAWINDRSRHMGPPTAEELSFRKKIEALNGKEVTLETKHLFADQWNCAEGLRIFNWEHDKWPNRHIVSGYWLEQTEEMRATLREIGKCGYCGAQEPLAKGYVFCPHCIDSEYLTVDSLHLTRIVAVCDTNNRRAPLSDGERAHLLPIYERAQIHGATKRGKARIASALERIEKEHAEKIANANEKKDAALWIMANAPGLLDNWIFYTHTGVHCFGWRTPLSEGVAAGLLGKISEFPFNYEIKREGVR